jgi:hypothetical protein
MYYARVWAINNRRRRDLHMRDQLQPDCECESKPWYGFCASCTGCRVRKPFPEHLPRERVVIPAPKSCPCCGSFRLSRLGKDIAETLDVIPRQWKVIQTVRARSPYGLNADLASTARTHSPAVSFSKLLQF